MLYSKNGAEALSRELFRAPTNEYRSAPFWGWNGVLKTEPLLDQIDVFKQMGFGGFFMHARAGLATPYLSDEYMARVRDCCEKARQEGMLAWLYDEDRYPSGPAGGIVTKNPAYTRRFLRITPYRYGEEPEGYSGGGFPRKADGELLAAFRLELDPSGDLTGYSPLADAGSGRENARYVYFERQAPTSAQSQTYSDTLNPEAVREFARVTYDRYKDTAGEYFGDVSPAIFTDEPQYAMQNLLRFAAEPEDVILPWTDDFADTYRAAYGADIMETLPELVWDRADGLHGLARFRYHDHVAERFASAFCDTLGDWCEDNGILFTGHVMGEGSLTGQTVHSGECMRCYRAFHIPGIDVLGKHKLEYTTAKQAQSAVRQQASQSMMSELYGVSGWDFDFRSFKLQGDWQAAVGVTLRVPHHAWYTMKGDAKRDYPGSIHYQAPWWREYRLLEDHYARLNTALTRGKPVVRVGVVHPIESVWVGMGSRDRSDEKMEALENGFRRVIDILTEGLVDFDLISESRLPELCPEGTNPLNVGEMAYDAVVVPALTTMRSTTLERLEAFRAAGGTLIFLGQCPSHVDAVPDCSARALYDKSVCIPFEPAALMAALEGLRFVEARLPGGGRAKHLIHTVREDGGCKWLFLATTRGQPSPDVDIPNQGIKFNVGQKYETEILRFAVSGEYRLEEYDTLTGEVRDIPASYRGGKTEFSRRWHMHDSLLLRLTPGKNEGAAPIPILPGRERHLTGEVPVTLDEPNVLLLDTAEYALDGGDYQAAEEILRLDNILRRKLNYPMRRRAVMQPYQTALSGGEHKVRLRYSIESEIDVKGACLALENRDSTLIRLNGLEVGAPVNGCFCDREIETVPLPELKAGENILELELPLHPAVGLEACYLLGDFGVSVRGVRKTVTAPVRKLAFGDWTTQDLPFYAGNVTYHLETDTGGAKLLRVPHYRGALIRTWVDGEDRGVIAFSPYALDLSALAAGTHRVDLKLYGTRQNCFAPLHHLDSIPFSQGPDGWRSTGDLFRYEYCLSEKGILSAPRLYWE